MSSPSDRNVVYVSSISKTFGGTLALNKCSFAARSGEIHAIVGENGSGKSTLAKMLAGIIHPDDGEITIDGGVPATPKIAYNLGLAMVFQEVLVAEGASIIDNIYISHDGFFRPCQHRLAKRREVQALLDRLVGTSLDLDLPVDRLSLSERQWVVIARALLGYPKALILDEATAALDQASVRRLVSEMTRLRSAGTCIMLITHRLAEIMEIADRVTVLRDGNNVGILEREQINEMRIIELMTGEATELQDHAPLLPPEREATERQDRASSLSSGRPVVTVSGVRLAKRDAPINLEMWAGEIIGVAGLEGHGQTEFVRAVAGVGTYFAGEICVGADQRIVINSLRDAYLAGVVYVPGDRKREGLFPNLSVFENFSLPLLRRYSRLGFIDLRPIRELFSTQLARLRVQVGRSADSITVLSGGNQQKILIARAIALDPSLSVFNDPTRGVDMVTKREFYDLLRNLAGCGMAVLFLSTELEEFFGLCNRVVVFRNGSIATVLSDREVASGPLLAAMFGATESLSDGDDVLGAGS